MNKLNYLHGITLLVGPCGDCVELSELRDSSRCNEADGMLSVVSVELPRVKDSKVS